MNPFLIGVTVFVIASLIAIVLTRRNRPAVAKRPVEEGFPPITDDEFMARCTPGTSRYVALRVRRIVAHRLAVRYEQVYPSTRFIEDLGAD